MAFMPDARLGRRLSKAIFEKDGDEALTVLGAIFEHDGVSVSEDAMQRFEKCVRRSGEQVGKGC
ncbi:hypothetical protein [Pararhizobium mangrovi]|uniref:Uncharacterized protein n=1 Tax=Pararhizobium mangrovi TaxID=2590452 RepID=A0A506UHE1_9HYPH|nr:hypothetical protein [Pararhizobium mangrovi]TPW32736.1 hypothetical protein FJU11_00475 [Pararhizobium mangrovi]